MSGDLRQFLQQHRAEIVKEAQRLDKLNKILNDKENKENLNGNNEELSTRLVNKVKAYFSWLSFKFEWPFCYLKCAFYVEIICNRSVFVGPFVVYVSKLIVQLLLKRGFWTRHHWNTVKHQSRESLLDSKRRWRRGGPTIICFSAVRVGLDWPDCGRPCPDIDSGKLDLERGDGWRCPVAVFR